MPSEPYRKLFVLGLVCGILGVLLWPLFLLGLISYPLAAHMQLMLSGMFLSFVSGFLMTALPRMSGARPASAVEVWIAVALISSGCVLALLGQAGFSKLMASLQLIFIFQFAIGRFMKRENSPPMGVLFIPVGLAWALYGSSVSGLQDLGVAFPGFALELAKVGLEQAFLLNLIVGLGSRLIPFLTRVAIADPSMQVNESKIRAPAILLALNISFFLQPIVPGWFAFGGRALILLYAAIAMFGILKPSIEFTYMGAVLRTAVWIAIAAYAALAAFPGVYLPLLHVLFIGGFALITLMIATRVVLSHGQHSLAPEQRSLALALTFSFLLLAAVLRAFYILPWAAAAWICGILAWTYGIGRWIAIRKI